MKLKVIAGNCILECMETSNKTAEFLIDMSEKYNFDLVYKSSFKKDNRSSVEYYSGLPLEESITVFEDLKRLYGLTLLTDFHNLYELDTEIVNIVNILQLPAFLSMQTELTLKMARKNKQINIKKGQFLAPQDVKFITNKIESTGNRNIMITERGTSFGYHDLIADPRAIYELKKFGYPVIFDVGHTVRKYGIPSSVVTGGAKEYISTLAKAMIAAGADGIFVEVHPEPKKALCDAATQLDFEEFNDLIRNVIPVWEVLSH